MLRERGCYCLCESTITWYEEPCPGKPHCMGAGRVESCEKGPVFSTSCVPSGHDTGAVMLGTGEWLDNVFEGAVRRRGGEGGIGRGGGCLGCGVAGKIIATYASKQIDISEFQVPCSGVRVPIVSARVRERGEQRRHFIVEGVRYGARLYGMR